LDLRSRLTRQRQHARRGRKRGGAAPLSRVSQIAKGAHVAPSTLRLPSEGFLDTQFITGRSVARSSAFYSEVLGDEVPVHDQALSNSWVIMNPGGGPTPDKPDISVVDHELGNAASSFITCGRRHPGLLRAVEFEGRRVRDTANREAPRSAATSATAMATASIWWSGRPGTPTGSPTPTSPNPKFARARAQARLPTTSGPCFAREPPTPGRMRAEW
jgi:hypothetical protein